VEAPAVALPPLEQALPEAAWRERQAADAARREEDARAAAGAEAAAHAAAAEEERARAEAEAAVARAEYLARVRGEGTGTGGGPPRPRERRLIQRGQQCAARPPGPLAPPPTPPCRSTPYPVQKPRTLEEAVDRLVALRMEEERCRLSEAFAAKQAPLLARIAQLEAEAAAAAGAGMAAAGPAPGAARRAPGSGSAGAARRQ
jgi:hypothetical protein